MATAGTLTHRIRFDSRTATSDEYGGSEGAFFPGFVMWAEKKYLRGTEAVQASRLAGKQPVLITIRSSPQSRTVGTDWRAVDPRSGETYNITAVNPTQDRQWIEILAVSGGGDG